jgi:hypothetical protein
MFVRRKAELANPGQGVSMTGEDWPAIYIPKLISPERKLPLCRLVWIFLSQTSGCRVPRIGEWFITSSDRSLVQAFECRRPHVHLAANLNNRWDVVA